MNFGHYLLILIGMFFLHIVDDYYLQGCLAQMKQQSWWEKNAPDEKYKHDYIMALFEHAFSWSFMIQLPWFVLDFISYDTGLTVCLVITYIYNTCVHAFVDTLKANEHILNLIEDQKIHFIQITGTWLILLLAYII